MKTGFKTKKEAEQFLQNNKESFSHLGFCPEIKDKCRNDCVCYCDPRISSNGFGSYITYTIYEASCSHVIISGFIYIGQ